LQRNRAFSTSIDAHKHCGTPEARAPSRAPSRTLSRARLSPLEMKCLLLCSLARARASRVSRSPSRALFRVAPAQRSFAVSSSSLQKRFVWRCTIRLARNEAFRVSRFDAQVFFASSATRACFSLHFPTLDVACAVERRAAAAFSTSRCRQFSKFARFFHTLSLRCTVFFSHIVFNIACFCRPQTHRQRAKKVHLLITRTTFSAVF